MVALHGKSVAIRLIPPANCTRPADERLRHPAKVGEPCPIKYVLYIIKENRTYDQVFGDFKDAHGKPAGNGDPHLTMYGEERDAQTIIRSPATTSCSTISIAMAKSAWTATVGATPPSRRISTNAPGSCPIPGTAAPRQRRNGNSRRGLPLGPLPAPRRELQELRRRRQARALGQPRQMDRRTRHRRVQSWIADLHAAEKTGELPRFTIMSLGEDHTRGTTPGASTPEACVASNDLALGRIVEAASRSRFWKRWRSSSSKTTPRTVPTTSMPTARSASSSAPTASAVVDSTFTHSASMIRTMELILGLPPMTQYDAGATPMFNSFGKSAKLRPYDALNPKVDLLAKNTKRSPYAKQSSPDEFAGNMTWHLRMN